MLKLGAFYLHNVAKLEVRDRFVDTKDSVGFMTTVLTITSNEGDSIDITLFNHEEYKELPVEINRLNRD